MGNIVDYNELGVSVTILDNSGGVNIGLVPQKLAVPLTKRKEKNCQLS